MHKLLIRESFDDYKSFKKNWKEKYPTLTGLMILNDYNNLNEETKKEWLEYIDKLNSLKEIIINNILSYCMNYPGEKISSNRFIREYKEYPYRLEQNIWEVLLDL
jgi:hypothetical protein